MRVIQTELRRFAYYAAVEHAYLSITATRSAGPPESPEMNRNEQDPTHACTMRARCSRPACLLKRTALVEAGMSSVASWSLSVPFRPVHNPMVARGAKAMSAKIRTVRADDRERIVRAFGALHPQSLYQRFFFPKRSLSDRELRWVTEPDGNRNVVLVATTCGDGQETVVALGQYMRSGASAEIAFLVAEDHQGRGIASRMLQELADIARRHGVTQFEADVLADNASMLKVFRHSNLPVSESEADGVVHLTLSLRDRHAHGRIVSLL